MRCTAARWLLFAGSDSAVQPNARRRPGRLVGGVPVRRVDAFGALRDGAGGDPSRGDVPAHPRIGPADGVGNGSVRLGRPHVAARTSTVGGRLPITCRGWQRRCLGVGVAARRRVAVFGCAASRRVVAARPVSPGGSSGSSGRGGVVPWSETAPPSVGRSVVDRGAVVLVDTRPLNLKALVRWAVSSGSSAGCTVISCQPGSPDVMATTIFRDDIRSTTRAATPSTRTTGYSGIWRPWITTLPPLVGSERGETVVRRIPEGDGTETASGSSSSSSGSSWGSSPSSSR